MLLKTGPGLFLLSCTRVQTNILICAANCSFSTAKQLLRNQSKLGNEKGELIYTVYRALTYGLSPLINLHLRWRKFRALEHHLRWRERLGVPSLPRPPGPLLLFHAVSLGEGMAAIPVINRCVQRRPDITVLMTTTTVSAFDVLKNLLPGGVIYQFAPLDTPSAVDNFLGYWKPNAIMLMESELWPNLVIGASKNGSTVQAIRFQLLQAPPFVINFSVDLKYGIEEFYCNKGDISNVEDLKVQFACRRVWLASSIHSGEEKVTLGAQETLMKMHPDMLTIIVPRHPQFGQEIAYELQRGVSVAVRSRNDTLTPKTSIYVVDTLGELRNLYRLVPIAFIGGSLLSSLTGHNISEAASAGCAVLTGPHLGHFSHMVMSMRQLNPSSVQQVSGRKELEEALHLLLSNPKVLEARRVAAKESFQALSNGVVENVWNLLFFHVFSKGLKETMAYE